MTAPYRDDTDSLEGRHAALSEELSSVQARTKELDALKASEERLAREVADVASYVAGGITASSFTPPPPPVETAAPIVEPVPHTTLGRMAPLTHKEPMKTTVTRSPVSPTSATSPRPRPAVKR